MSSGERVASHYDTLGVAPDASTAEIRDAYRRLARRHHPDRRGDHPGLGADGGPMAAINEAYRVLGEPARRAVYDASRRACGSAAGPSSSPTVARPQTPPPAVDNTPARYPWKLMLWMAALGTGVVLVGTALYEPPGPERPDNLLEPGSCVTIEANGDAREVACAGTDELVVVVLVPIDGRCPDRTTGHRDRQGRGLACVASVP